MDVLKVAETLKSVGINFLEITLTTPNPFEAIKKVKSALGDDFFVGAGTVTTQDLANRSIDAGVDFLVAPNLDPKVIQYADQKEVLSIPGCLTPTEIQHAADLGLDLVKLFPASLGGPKYLRELRGPFPEMRFMPTGSLSLDNVGDFLQAGAVAVGVGGALVNPGDVQDGRFDLIADTGAKFRAAVDGAPR